MTIKLPKDQWNNQNKQNKISQVIKFKSALYNINFIAFYDNISLRIICFFFKLNYYNDWFIIISKIEFIF